MDPGTMHNHGCRRRRLLPRATAMLGLILSLLLAGAEAKLSKDYYQKSCPRIHDVIQQTVTGKQITNPTTAAGTLRLFFHDCFPNGCDASVLVSSNSFVKAERDVEMNVNLPGDAFDVIVRAKTALELECPGVVSCADILAVATRDLITMLGGPFYEVRLGRKDSLNSSIEEADHSLPKSDMSMTEIIKLFTDRGFTVQEIVALSGAHTVGFSHCKEFANRIFGDKEKNLKPDETMNSQYADALRKACDNYQQRTTVAAFNDIMTPNKFDNMYFQNLAKGLGLLATDTALLTDPQTRPFAQLYATNQTAFFEDFAHAMEKLSVHGVKTGNKGEVRRRCDAFNSLNV